MLDHSNSRTRLSAANLSLYAGLTRQGHAPTSADEWLTALVSDIETDALLGCDPATPLMRVRRATRDSSGNLVEVVDATYLGSLYRHHVDSMPIFAPSTSSCVAIARSIDPRLVQPEGQCGGLQSACFRGTDGLGRTSAGGSRKCCCEPFGH